MPLWHRLKSLWRNFAQTKKIDEDLDAEVRSYQAMLEDDEVRRGADRRRARRHARMELGSPDLIKEQVRDVRSGAGMSAMWAELRQSMRALGRNPALTGMAIVVLALGIGSSTAVFSIFYAALVKPLPFREMDRVVELWETRLDRGFSRASFTEANFWDVRARNRSFEEIGACHYDEANLTGDGPAEKVTIMNASAGFFRALGVTPLLGRDFLYDEDRSGSDARVAILGNRFWLTRFGGDPAILGKSLRLNDRTYTVVGVLPPGEPWINQQIYAPLVYRADANRGSFEFGVVGRLAKGVSMEAARADLQGIAASLGEAYPKDDKGIGFNMAAASTWVASDTTRRALWLLLGAVSFLLVIACLNIANLLLARGMSRKREIAVRTALGASRGRLVRFVLIESVVLSLLGAALGVVLADISLHGIRLLEIRGVPRLADAGLNPWVLAFAALIAVVTGILSGLAPALQTPWDGIAGALREGDRQTGSRGQGRLRAALVTGEVALSFLLLVGAGLMIRSLSQLMSVDRGFHTENRLVFAVSFPGSYWQKGVGKQFLDRFLERLSGLPQVVAAGAVSHRPVESMDPGMGIDAAKPAAGAEQRTIPWAGWRLVSPGYFRAVGLPLLSGRVFDEGDRSVWREPGEPAAPRRVVISNRLANLLFPNGDAVGQTVILWKGQNGGEADVVGVVGDSRERGLASDPTLTVYLPFGANALTGEFVVQARGNPLSLMPAVRSIVAGLDPNLPISNVRSFEEVVERSVAPQRFNAALLGVFSSLALLLATVGIYGVLSYSMSRRTSEIGLRVALGASGFDVLRMAISQGMRPALLGIAVGALGAFWLSRYLASLLFGIKPFDWVTYAAVAALLMATAMVACYLPGRRAMGIDPAVALRVE